MFQSSHQGKMEIYQWCFLLFSGDFPMVFCFREGGRSGFSAGFANAPPAGQGTWKTTPDNLQYNSKQPDSEDKQDKRGQDLLSWIRKACQTTDTLCWEWRQRGVFVGCRRATWLRDSVRICPFCLQIHPLQKSRRCARGLPEAHLSRVVFRVVRVVLPNSNGLSDKWCCGGGGIVRFSRIVKQGHTQRRKHGCRNSTVSGTGCVI